MIDTGISTTTPANFLQAGNLNIPTSFIGRHAELERIAQFMRDPNCRLLTLLGPGGVGKTRLAIEAARHELGHFADGIYWVDLQAGNTPQFLLNAIAGALALPGAQEPRHQILDFLADKSILMILDNFEQLLDATDVPAEIIQASTNVKLLVTSRAALHIQEEWLYPIAGLPYPQTGDPTIAPLDSSPFDAVQLFIERVQRVRPDYSAQLPLPSEEQTALGRICQLVEGIPLALELAASWARSMDTASIAAEIERNQATFLTSVLRNIPDRHRSMWAVFSHSWSLLSPAEQETFRQLAVFRGGFRREAAVAVAGAPLPILTGLVDKSLLRWQVNGRYEIHALLRQYAEMHLEEAGNEMEQVRARHATYYLEFLAQRTEAIRGSRQKEAADEIAAELDNIRLAWQWAVEQHEIAAIGRALDPLAMFFHIKARYLEAASTYQAFLDILQTQDPMTARVRASVLSELGWITIRLGEFARAQAVLEECAAIYRRLDRPPPPGLGTDPCLGLSTLASIRGDYGVAAQLAQQARHTATTHGQLHNLQNAHFQLANIAYAQGNYAQAYASAQAAYAICQQTGDRWFMAYCLNELGQAARALGDLSAAHQYYTTSFTLREAFSDPEGKALALQNLGDIALRQREYAQAQKLFEQSVNTYRTISDKGGLAAAYCGLGKTAFARQDYAAAQSLFRQALDIAQEIQFTPLLLSILAACGHFFIHTHRLPLGLALLSFVHAHAATSHELKAGIHEQLTEYADQVAPTLYAEARRLGQESELSAAVTWVMTELIAGIPQQPETLSPSATPSPPTEIVAQAPVSHTDTLPTTTMPLNDSSDDSSSPVADLFQSSPSSVEPLTPREEEVLRLIAQGFTNQQISERLHVVIGTVKAHNNSIFGKLGVKNRVQALARARALNLL